MMRSRNLYQAVMAGGASCLLGSCTLVTSSLARQTGGVGKGMTKAEVRKELGRAPLLWRTFSPPAPLGSDSKWGDRHDARLVALREDYYLIGRYSDADGYYEASAMSGFLLEPWIGTFAVVDFLGAMVSPESYKVWYSPEGKVVDVIRGAKYPVSEPPKKTGYVPEKLPGADTTFRDYRRSANLW